MNFVVEKQITIDNKLFEEDEGFQLCVDKSFAIELGSELFKNLDNKKHFYVIAPVDVTKDELSTIDRTTIQKTVNVTELDDFLKYLERKGLINLRTVMIGRDRVSVTEYLLLTRGIKG